MWHINVYNRFAPPPDQMIMFFDNHLAPPTRYKRECSNKFVLLNMDCGFSYFDELVTYYATLFGESSKSEPVVLRWRDSRCAFANLLLARLYLFDLILLKFHSIVEKEWTGQKKQSKTPCQIFPIFACQNNITSGKF